MCCWEQLVKAIHILMKTVKTCQGCKYKYQFRLISFNFIFIPPLNVSSYYQINGKFAVMSVVAITYVMPGLVLLMFVPRAFVFPRDGQ